MKLDTRSGIHGVGHTERDTWKVTPTGGHAEWDTRRATYTEWHTYKEENTWSWTNIQRRVHTKSEKVVYIRRGTHTEWHTRSGPQKVEHTRSGAHEVRHTESNSYKVRFRQSVTHTLWDTRGVGYIRSGIYTESDTYGVGYTRNKQRSGTHIPSERYIRSGMWDTHGVESGIHNWG